MTDPGQKIAQAFEREGRLDESAFQWLADLLNRNKEAAELLNFSIGYGGSSGKIALLIHDPGFFGPLCQQFLDQCPAPFAIEVLNNPDPNPGATGAVVSWGGGR